MAKKTEEKINIKLVKSLIGVTKKQISIVNALGLKKTNDVVQHLPSDTVVGMIKKVSHLLLVY